jgi:hypothetical protein
MVLPPRRSTRSAVLNANGKREAPDTWSQWRGERRSTRLGAPLETQLDLPPKRARTEESTISTTSAGATSADGPSPSSGEPSGLKIKIRGAAAVKPSEIALEQVAGRKKSKFWFYAVEPIEGAQPSSLGESANGAGPSETTQNGENNTNVGPDHSDGLSDHENGIDNGRNSLSPVPSILSV